MKTIEERAKKYALQFEKRYQVAMFKAYIDGATEQKQIDDQHILFLADAHEHEKKMLIDKACEVYRKELSEIISTFNHLGKRLYDIEELGELISLEGSINDFRKAMK